MEVFRKGSTTDLLVRFPSQQKARIVLLNDILN